MSEPSSHTGELQQKTPGLPAVTVGVITLERRKEAFKKLLDYLDPALCAYAGETELLICNNGSPDSKHLIEHTLSGHLKNFSGVVRVVNSTENNIATGRNVVLDSATHNLVAFLDDDEYPTEHWLSELVAVQQECQSVVVAGPVVPVFEDACPKWVKTTDLHNVRGRINKGQITKTGTGNVLIDSGRIENERFTRSFGQTGGSDTEFFLRLHDKGHLMHWASEAMVYEDIPADRAQTAYLLKRFRIQGNNYRRIMQARGAINSMPLFLAKALFVCCASLPIAVILWILRRPTAGDWLKRSASNYGKLSKPAEKLYD